MSGSHLIHSLKRKQKKPQNVQQNPCCKEVGKKRKKRQHNTSGMDGQVWDEDKDKHIDGSNGVKNIIMG